MSQLRFHPLEVVFSADEAVRRCKDGEKVILVRIETSPDDIHGLHAAEGVLTTRGKDCFDSSLLSVDVSELWTLDGP